MPTFLAILLTASHITLGANRVPDLNVEPSCRAAAEAAVAPIRDAKVCEREEITARGKLNNEWGQFTPTQKMYCMTLSRLGGSPSYVELLTCLELAKAAKRLPPRDHMTGQGRRGRLHRAFLKKRRHSTLSYLSKMEFEMNAMPISTGLRQRPNLKIIATIAIYGP